MNGKENHETKFLREHLATLPSGLLSHYTDAGGFKGIIENKAIWMTDALYLNDSEELLLAFRMVRDYANELEKKYQEHLEEAEKNLRQLSWKIEGKERELESRSGNETSRQELEQEIEELKRDIEMDYESMNTHSALKTQSWKLSAFQMVLRTLNEVIEDPSRLNVEIYVVSFSTKQNHLSQWRGYCPQGGYALVFDYEDIRDIIQQQDLVLGKCLYNRTKTSDNDFVTIRNLIKELVEELISLGFEDAAGGSVRDVKQQIVERVASISPFIKHGGFYEEEEWRLVNAEIVFPPMQDFSLNHSSSGQTLEEKSDREDTNYRLRDRLIAPYINFSLKDYDLHKLRVVVGPMPNQAEAGVSTKGFLAKQRGVKLDKIIEQVELSEIPYRI